MTARSLSGTTYIPLVEAAQRLRKGYFGTLNMLLRGELSGHKDARGRWMVDAADIHRYASTGAEKN